MENILQVWLHFTRKQIFKNGKTLYFKINGALVPYIVQIDLVNIRCMGLSMAHVSQLYAQRGSREMGICFQTF